MQVDRIENYNIVQSNIKNTLLYQEKRGSYGTCIFPISAPKKGGSLHHWAVIRNYLGKPLILVRKQIGYKASQDGEAHDVCFIENKDAEPNKYICINNKTLNIVAKLVPISETSLKNIDNVKYQPWREIYIMTLTSNFVLNSLSPHFPLYYKHFVCPYADPAMFKNINIIRRLNNNAKMLDIQKNIVDIGKNLEELSVGNRIYQNLKPKFDLMAQNFDQNYTPGYGKGVATILMEKGGQDLAKFFDYSNKIDTEIIYNISFQILQALATLHECTNVVHMDLHLYNILVKDNHKPPKGKKYYKIFDMWDKKYYVPHIDFDIWIIDFGRSEMLDYAKANDLALIAKREHNFLFNANKTATFYSGVKHNLNKNLPFFREFFKSFDVLRVFNELHNSCRDIVDPSALTFLSHIIADAKTDFLTHLPDIKFRAGDPNKYYYAGHPKNLLEKYFFKKKIFTTSLEDDEEWINNKPHNDVVYGINNKIIKDIQFLKKKQFKNSIKNIKNLYTKLNNNYEKYKVDVAPVEPHTEQP